jgi:hypothetical protein
MVACKAKRLEPELAGLVLALRNYSGVQAEGDKLSRIKTFSLKAFSLPT